MLFSLFAVLLLVFVLVRFLSYSRRRSGGGRGGAQGQQPVEFVVNTFHELVAQLKEKERELEQLHSHAELRADTYESYSENILQCVPSGMITFDVEGRIVTVNRAAADIMDLDAKTLPGKPAQVLGPAIASILKAPETSPRERREATFDTSRGEKRWLGFFTSSLKDRDDRRLGTILGFSDLTEVKLLKEKVELRERLSHLGEVSAGIAHEIRNPMAVIAGYAQMLDSKTPDEAPTKKAVQAIRREIAGMNRVINDFLHFARPTALNATSVDLVELMPDILDSALQNRKNISVQVGLAEGFPVRADETLIRQAFINLVQNAGEAMPEGGSISISSLPKKDLLEIVIRDTGPGIPEELRGRLFLPFVTGKDDGTGLGLAIVHKITVLHEGTMTVESDESGAAFSLQLPLALSS
jgi:PAS domain S-box-containing protein